MPIESNGVRKGRFSFSCPNTPTSTIHEEGEEEEDYRDHDGGSSTSYVTIKGEGEETEAQEDLDDNDNDATPVTPPEGTTTPPMEVIAGEDALLLFRDFWVRTKAPLTYNILMVHSLPGTQVEVRALARPVKCFKTRVSKGSEKGDEGEESFLQCLRVEETLNKERASLFSTSSDNHAANWPLLAAQAPSPPGSRFALWMSTRDWPSNIELKFVKEGLSHHFATATVPLSSPGESQGAGHSEDPSCKMTSDKVAITSARRKIRIGTLKYLLAVGKQADLVNLIQNKDIFQGSDSSLGGSGWGASSHAPSVVPDLDPKNKGEGRRGNPFPGLVVTPSSVAEEDDPEDQEVSFSSLEQEDVLDVDEEEEKKPASGNALKTGDKDKGPPPPLMDKELSTIHFELEEKVTALAGQVSSYSSKLLRTETELSELREEVTALRRDKTSHASTLNTLKTALHLAEAKAAKAEESSDRIEIIQKLGSAPKTVLKKVREVLAAEETGNKTNNN